MESIRIDSFLWCVRIFKSRSKAAEACKKGRITISGVNAKPARMIQRGDIIEVKKPPIVYSFKVLDIPKNRMGAKMVHSFVENVTAPEQYELLELQKLSGFIGRAKGEGRPTKKDRRDLDAFIEDIPESFFFGDEFDFDD